MKSITRILIGMFCLLVSTHALAEPQKVLIKTSMGEITVELDADKAPLSVANFLAYVDAGFYDGTIFHRVIPDFMIQGGGLDAEFAKKSTLEPVENEAKNGLKNARGSIAMARTGDPHSATAQFFINLKDNGFLDQSGNRWGYAVFGKVTDGMDVVNKIKDVKTGNYAYHQDAPVEDVVIQKVEVSA